jgi:hypothetical protein
VAPPAETLPAGNYVLRVTYENDAPSATHTFELSDVTTSNAAAYSEVQFTLATSTPRTYNDVLRLNIWPQFSQVYVTHNTLTTAQYDYFFFTFRLAQSVVPVLSPATAETTIVIDVTSRNHYAGVVTGYEDLGVVTDTKMFAGEPSGKFVHG